METQNPYGAPQAVSSLSYQSRGTLPSPIPRLAALVAIVMFGMVILSDLLLGISTYMQISLIEDFVYRGIVPSTAAGEANDFRHLAFTLVWAGMLLACCVTFIVWMFRARKAYPYLGAIYFKHSPGGTIGWWFCPIANLFMPCKVMLEISRKSNPETYNGLDTWNRDGARPIIGFWWTSWIVAQIVWRVADTLADKVNDDDPETFLPTQWCMLVACAIQLVSAVLAALMIRQITKDQQRLYELISGGAFAVRPVTSGSSYPPNH